MSNSIKVGDVVYLKSDHQHKIVMTVEGPPRARDDLSAAMAHGQFQTRPGDVSCVWVDRNGNIRHDDFGAEALVLIPE